MGNEEFDFKNAVLLLSFYCSSQPCLVYNIILVVF